MKTTTNETWAGVPEHLASAIQRYAVACVNESWKGGGDPADWPEIEEELKEAEADLIRRLKAERR